MPTKQSIQSHEPGVVDEVVAYALAVGSLNVQALERGRRAAQSSGERLDIVLNKLGLISDDALVEAWSHVTGLGIINSDAYPEIAILPEILAAPFLLHARILPVRMKGGELELAVIDPLDRFSPAAVSAKTGLPVRRLLARPGEFETIMKRLYDGDRPKTGEDTIEADTSLSLDVERLRDLASDAPVIRIVNTLIDRAIELRASDVHVMPKRDGLRVRYRIDGILKDVEPPSAQLHAAIVSRLKIMARLDIAERRLPQDGRIRIAWRGREVDLRIATMPHVNGEGVVLRILDRSATALDFAALGLSKGVIETLDQILTEPHGVFLVTGPTGSGKTTTLYAALQAMSHPTRNIVTVEDPVEYHLNGISQIQVSRKIGLDFASSLRAVLRQDPDIIMVGEIRDHETAIVANQAALTGHFVLATLHTNSALAALPRLIDMGVEPYLLASTLKGTMAQRLVRRLCSHCCEPVEVSFGAVGRLHDTSHHSGPRRVFRPVGCARCQGSGYVGRVALAEIMTMTQATRACLMKRADESRLTAVARNDGFRSLLEDGLAKAEAGVTSLEEVMRVVGSG